MIIKALFVDSDYFEILDISLDNFDEIEKLQHEFLAWMFDKSNEHEYWVKIGKNKIGCEYGIEAFIKWMNINHRVEVQILDTYGNANFKEIYF